MLTGKMGGPSSQPASFLAHYAHSLAGRPKGEWHKLEEHLTQTADLAESFASPFASEWGRLAGLWHDAGKFQRSFQIRIDKDDEAHTNAKVDHSSVGVLIAKGHRARPLSFVIAGHHGGMPNADDLVVRLNERADLGSAQCNDDNSAYGQSDSTCWSPRFARQYPCQIKVDSQPFIG